MAPAKKKVLWLSVGATGPDGARQPSWERRAPPFHDFLHSSCPEYDIRIVDLASVCDPRNRANPHAWLLWILRAVAVVAVVLAG